MSVSLTYFICMQTATQYTLMRNELSYFQKQSDKKLRRPRTNMMTRRALELSRNF